MTDITEILMQYRECARSVYNKYFKDWGDGSHDFQDVNRELFTALVLSRLSKWRKEFAWREPAEFIRVRYNVFEKGLDVDRLTTKHGNMNKWSLWTLKDSSAELAFVSFFDWSNPSDYQDYQLVECHVTGANSSNGLSMGERLLIDIRYVKFEEDDDK